MQTIKNRIESFMKGFAWSMMRACFITLFITFVIAYFNPGKSVVIYINHYGEANLELFLMCFGAISILYMIHQEVKND